MNAPHNSFNHRSLEEEEPLIADNDYFANIQRQVQQ